jgi:NADP-dependent 3-hydroxy acid dehydrogenase YdfG
MKELDRLVAQVAETTDRVDILFANAGAMWMEKFDTHPEKTGCLCCEERGESRPV